MAVFVWCPFKAIDRDAYVNSAYMKYKNTAGVNEINYANPFKSLKNGDQLLIIGHGDKDRPQGIFSSADGKLMIGANEIAERLRKADLPSKVVVHIQCVMCYGAGHFAANPSGPAVYASTPPTDPGLVASSSAFTIHLAQALNTGTETKYPNVRIGGFVGETITQRDGPTMVSPPPGYTGETPNLKAPGAVVPAYYQYLSWVDAEGKWIDPDTGDRRDAPTVYSVEAHPENAVKPTA